MISRSSLGLAALIATGVWVGPASAAPKAPASPTAKPHTKPTQGVPVGVQIAKAASPADAQSSRRASSARVHSVVPTKAKVNARSRQAAKHPSTTHRKCQHAPVAIERAELHETSNVALTDCDGRPRREAQEALTSLARLRGTGKPKGGDFEDVVEDGEVIERGVALMHHGLLERLQRISDHFPNKTIAIVSGYRPESDGSLHQRARAIDIRLTGVDNVVLVAFCRTLADTGCGYYPNSSFVHVDVRPPSSGRVTWIDASGPGEKPRYVSSWPPSKADLEQPVGAEGGDDPYTENIQQAPPATAADRGTPE